MSTTTVYSRSWGIEKQRRLELRPSFLCSCDSNFSTYLLATLLRKVHLTECWDSLHWTAPCREAFPQKLGNGNAAKNQQRPLHQLAWSATSQSACIRLWLWSLFNLHLVHPIFAERAQPLFSAETMWNSRLRALQRCFGWIILPKTPKLVSVAQTHKAGQQNRQDYAPGWVAQVRKFTKMWHL